MRIRNGLNENEWRNLTGWDRFKVVSNILMLIVILLVLTTGGCAVRVEVDEPGEWDSVYIGTTTVVYGGARYPVQLYKAIIPEEGISIYIAYSTSSQGMGIAVVSQ